MKMKNVTLVVLLLCVSLALTANPIETNDPPENVEAEVQNINNVFLTWDPPASAGQIIEYQTGYDNNGIGTGGVASWYSAARFTAEELSAFYGDFQISTVNYHIRDPQFTGLNVVVWEGGSFGNPGTEVYNADVTDEVNVGDWSSHTLDTPIPLEDGNEYWIGYSIDATGDHPASVDAGPMEPDKGGWIALAGGAWEQLTDFDLNFNWCIQGVVTPVSREANAQPVVLSSKTNTTTEATNQNLDLSHSGNASFAQPIQNTFNRSLVGYNIYRNGDIIETINDVTAESYTDSGLDNGTYEYFLTALYSGDEESDPSNIVEVTVELLPPSDFNAQSQNDNVMCTWQMPTGGTNITLYKIYRNDELQGETTSVFFVDQNVPTGTHTYYAIAVYNDEYESEPSDEIVVDHVDAHENTVPAITTLKGNHPNPFNPETTITFALKNAGDVSLTVYNIKGEKVRTLVNGTYEASEHTVVWNGKDDRGNDVGSGIYFYKMDTADYTSTRKMILLK